MPKTRQPARGAFAVLLWALLIVFAFAALVSFVSAIAVGLASLFGASGGWGWDQVTILAGFGFMLVCAAMSCGYKLAGKAVPRDSVDSYGPGVDFGGGD